MKKYRVRISKEAKAELREYLRYIRDKFKSKQAMDAIREDYCRFIHAYCQRQRVEKILFLSRDGDTLRRSYEMLFPEDNFCYALWSRKAATKLMADHDRHDFFRRFIFHKVNQGYQLRDVFRAMELEGLLPHLGACGHAAEEELTDHNAPAVKRLIEDHWEMVRRLYGEQSEAAKQYYRELTGGKKKAAAVDIFWELLLSSTEPQLAGFSKDGPVFGDTDKNPEGIKEIRRGILDFISEYTKRFAEFPYMFRIEGRDAYAPLLAASGKRERYLRAIAERFDLHVNVD